MVNCSMVEIRVPGLSAIFSFSFYCVLLKPNTPTLPFLYCSPLNFISLHVTRAALHTNASLSLSRSLVSSSDLAWANVDARQKHAAAGAAVGRASVARAESTSHYPARTSSFQKHHVMQCSSHVFCGICYVPRMFLIMFSKHIVNMLKSWVIVRTLCPYILKTCSVPTLFNVSRIFFLKCRIAFCKFILKMVVDILLTTFIVTAAERRSVKAPNVSGWQVQEHTYIQTTWQRTQDRGRYKYWDWWGKWTTDKTMTKYEWRFNKIPKLNKLQIKHIGTHTRKKKNWRWRQNITNA